MTMKLCAHALEVATQGRGFVDVTGKIADIVAACGVRDGLCTVFLRHTSAGLVIQENADSSVLRDLGRWLAELAPDDRGWEHDAEGADDMPGHAKALLTRTSETVPIQGGKLALGTWQAIYLCEFRVQPHRRKLSITIVGE
jgi:secondary thiamine-phosphate synthase enzyme